MKNNLSKSKPKYIHTYFIVCVVLSIFCYIKPLLAELVQGQTQQVYPLQQVQYPNQQVEQEATTAQATALSFGSCNAIFDTTNDLTSSSTDTNPICFISNGQLQCIIGYEYFNTSTTSPSVTPSCTPIDSNGNPFTAGDYSAEGTVLKPIVTLTPSYQTSPLDFIGTDTLNYTLTSSAPSVASVACHVGAYTTNTSTQETCSGVPFSCSVSCGSGTVQEGGTQSCTLSTNPSPSVLGSTSNTQCFYNGSTTAITNNQFNLDTATPGTVTPKVSCQTTIGWSPSIVAAIAQSATEPPTSTVTSSSGTVTTFTRETTATSTTPATIISYDCSNTAVAITCPAGTTSNNNTAQPACVKIPPPVLSPAVSTPVVGGDIMVGTGCLNLNGSTSPDLLMMGFILFIPYLWLRRRSLVEK